MTYNDIHDKMNQVTLGLITKEELHQWFEDNVQVTTYLSIIQKYALIEAVKLKFDATVIANVDTGETDDYGATYYAMNYDVQSTLIVLGYYTKAFAQDKDLTMKEYDLVMSTGYYDYVYDKAGKDMQDTFKKCERVVGVDNYFLVRDFIKQFTTGYSPEKAKAVRQELNKIDLRKLQLMKDVAHYNSPVATEVAKYLYRNEKQNQPLMPDKSTEAETTEEKPPIVIAPTADTPIE